MACYSRKSDFADVNSATVLHLHEPASALEVIHRFLHPTHYPNLDDKDFDAVIALGRAAEQVFAAMSVCKMRLRFSLRSVKSLNICQRDRWQSA